MEFKDKNSGASGQEMPSSSEEKVSNELIIESEKSFEEDEEVKTFGVYVNAKEKTLLGLFWDEKMAKLFKDAVQNSDLMNEVRSVV